jgi:hypothetical protein
MVPAVLHTVGVHRTPSIARQAEQCLAPRGQHDRHASMAQPVQVRSGAISRAASGDDAMTA